MVNPSYRDTALRYCVDDLPGASMPGARLQKILDCLQFGKPVTSLSLAFLQQQGLVALYRLATGMLPYDSFRELALAEQSVRVGVHDPEAWAHEAEARAREAEARTREATMREKVEQARPARESDPKYIANLKQKKLRTQNGIDAYVEPHCPRRPMDISKRVDLGQRLNHSKVKVEASMVNPSYRDTALRYCVDDLSTASIPGAPLQQILDCLQFGKPVTSLYLAYLQQKGLVALYRLATGMLPYDSFRELALAEKSVRVEAVTTTRRAREAEAQAREAEAQAREAAMWKKMERARLARESDPKYIAQKELLTRYGIGTYDESQQCFRRLMDILKRVDAGQRLSEEDFVWLSSVGKHYFTEKLRAAYHRLEADFFAGQFKKTNDSWAAVNASGHYRKCGCASEANSLLGTINIDRQKPLKLKSALCTTHGGVMRDLGLWNEALGLGEKAHTFKPDDYRPCTLLGAIHMDIKNYQLGQEWFDKAIKRGAKMDNIDQEIRNIFFRSDATKKKEMREFLLHHDPIRYAWVMPKTESHKE